MRQNAAVAPPQATGSLQMGTTAGPRRLPRVARFALTGVVAGAAQLLILRGLLDTPLAPIEANSIAFALAAQLNFALSRAFTWGDRPHVGSPATTWVRFMSGITATALLNLGVFAIASSFVGAVPAAASGILAAASANYLIGDRAVFRERRPPSPAPE